MNLRKKVFIDLNGKQKDLIISVLDKYCVPYDLKTNEISCIFGYIETYDISVNLSIDEKDGISPYNFIIEKVNERLQLEESFNSPCIEPECAELTETQIRDYLPDFLSDILEGDSQDKVISPKQTDNKNIFTSLLKELNKMFKFKKDIKVPKDNVVNYEDLPIEIKSALKEKIPEEILKNKCIIKFAPGGLVIKVLP